MRKFYERSEEEFGRSRARLDELIDAAFRPLDETLPGDIPTVSEFRAAARRLQHDFSALMTVAGQVLDRLEHLRSTAAADLEGDYLTFKEQLENANKAQQAHSILLSDNKRLNTTQSATLQEEIVTRHAAEISAPAVARLAEVRARLSGHIADLSRILKEATKKVQDYSSGSLTAKSKREACPPEYVSAVRALIEGAGIQDAADKAKSWITNLTPEGWTDVCNGVLGIYERKVMLGSPPEPSEDLKSEICRLLLGEQRITDRGATRIYANLNDATVGALLAAVPKNHIILTYVDEKGRSFSFDKASPGQQAAALLELLLKQEAGTLIIDQPEDDLDNKVIMRIVDLIRTSKSKRQLIFSTHNPNVVVNGDADKIISLTTGEIDQRPNNNKVRIAVEEDGAIETTEIRRLITEVMEGGKDAFNLRRRKYRFGQVA